MKRLILPLTLGGYLAVACGDESAERPDGEGGARQGDGDGDGDADGIGGRGGRSGQGGEGGSAGAMTDAEDPRRFTVVIENVAETYPFLSGGVFHTPVGDSTPGPLTHGKKYEFSVHAGRRQKLSFVTMLAATNDLFFAPDGEGIALYDATGAPRSGDVSDQLRLWDAGTEVNEEPAVGPNTVAKQSMPNTGPDEHGVVRPVEEVLTDTFGYPDVSEVISVHIDHVSGTEFLITIENVSENDALMTSEGDRKAPVSPGVWVIHGGSSPLFEHGMPDRGLGLEKIAEDGDPKNLGDYIKEHSGVTYPASPGVWVTHDEGDRPFFEEAAFDEGAGLEHIAEDGNPTDLAASLSAWAGAAATGVMDMPEGRAAKGPITPGLKYTFSFTASRGQSLSFATMLAATNDVFIAPADSGIALFDDQGTPLRGDITNRLYLWDVGTEKNEQPALGPNTVTNQLTANTGKAEREAVKKLSDENGGFDYPAVLEVLKVTIRSERP